jgi:hypothetical protein
MTRIEKGEKVPGEEVAVALARVLGDEPELYLAWIHARYFSDPASTLEGLHRVGYRDSPSPLSRLRSEREREEKRVEKLAEKRRRLEREIEQRAEELLHRDEERAMETREIDESRLDDAVKTAGARQAKLTGPRSRMLRWAHAEQMREMPPDTAAEFPGVTDEGITFFSADLEAAEATVRDLRTPVHLPVLEYGLDPGKVPAESGHVVDWLWLDPCLLPHGPAPLFAYRIDREDLEGGPADLEPGALVILTRNVEDPPDPERLYAVRTPRSEKRAEGSGGGPVYVTRVRPKGDSLIVFPPGMSTDVEIIELDDGRDLSEILVGECLLFVRRAPGQPRE